MKANVLGCLAAFILGCNVTAAIILQIVEEKTSVTLPCPHAVDRKVTWSREKDGRKVDIFTTDGDRDTRHDTDRRYNIQADKSKSLYIIRVTVSDSGRYFCNNEEAVELTVIPSGTNRSDAVLKTSVRLKCSSHVAGSDAPTWIRQSGGKKVTVFSQTEENNGRFQYSTEEKTLIISDVQLDDAGLYYCDGKPSTTVSKDEQPQKVPVLVLAVVLPVLLFVIFILLFLTWRCSVRRRRSGEQGFDVVYAEMPDEPTQGGSNQRDVTYSVIQNLPESKTTTTVRSQPNKMVYSLINQAA
ncbi:hypothetical protein L3Q82_003234 [Scortum barcoo]|uniref:Uncharacterized protein n=1 Tax=Scortum barcoo TaxID=214431 RepID=A0ACB8VRY6_9TELE|nr:hypothetical protein L3Q82_003234 [Scortum barcoo]